MDEDIVQSLWKHKAVFQVMIIMYVYLITNRNSDKFYIGITNNVIKRKNSHIQVAKGGKKSPLYDWMRKYNFEFDMTILKECFSREEACTLEKKFILLSRESGLHILNIADGGDGGFSVNNIDEWKCKLSAARKGRQPAKGMSHTDENKKLFSEISKSYWSTQDTYTKNVAGILKLSHKEAKVVYGISTTHYYRLKKRFENNELK